MGGDEGEAPTPASDSMIFERISASFCPSKSCDSRVSAQMGWGVGSANAPTGSRGTTDDLAVYDISDLVQELFRHRCVAGSKGWGATVTLERVGCAMPRCLQAGVYGVQMCCEAWRLDATHNLHQSGVGWMDQAANLASPMQWMLRPADQQGPPCQPARKRSCSCARPLCGLERSAPVHRHVPIHPYLCTHASSFSLR